MIHARDPSSGPSSDNALVLDLDEISVTPTYLTDSSQIEIAVEKLLLVPAHPESTAGWWCAHSDQMTQLIPFHAESLSCSQPLWAGFRQSVAVQLSTCSYCVIAYQKASNAWEVSEQFHKWDRSFSRNLLRSLAQWNIDRLIPSIRLGALDISDCNSETIQHRAGCRHGFLEALLCPRACMDKRIYSLVFAVFRRHCPIEISGDLIPLVQEYGSIPPGLVYFCFHPKMAVSTWAHRALKECASKFAIVDSISLYILSKAFATVQRLLLNFSSCDVITAFVEVPLPVLLEGFDVILPLLANKMLTNLIQHTNSEAIKALTKALENKSLDVVTRAASCLETLLLKAPIDGLFKPGVFSVNELLQCLLKVVRLNIMKVATRSDHLLPETISVLRLFGPFFVAAKKLCSRTEVTRMYSACFDALELILQEIRTSITGSDLAQGHWKADLHHHLNMTCASILNWFHAWTAPKRPLENTSRISKFVTSSLSEFSEAQWCWDLLKVVLIGDVSNFIHCIFSNDEITTIVAALTDMPECISPKSEVNNIVQILLNQCNDDERSLSFVSSLWNDIRNGRHVKPPKLTSVSTNHEVRIFLELHSVLGVSDPARISSALEIEKISRAQVEGIDSGGCRYIQDSIHLMQDAITARLNFALSMDNVQGWREILPFHATHMLSSANKALSGEAMRVLMRIYNAPSSTVGGSKGKMLVQLMKSNGAHLQLLISGFSSTIRVLGAWGSRISMGSHARFFLLFRVLLDLRVDPQIIERDSAPLMLKLLWSFVSSWKEYQNVNSGECFNEVCVRFFHSLRQVWPVFVSQNNTNYTQINDVRAESIKELVVDVSLGLMDMHEIRGDLPRSTWVQTIGEIGSSMKNVSGFSEKLSEILKLYSTRRSGLSLQQCQYIAERLQLTESEPHLLRWAEEEKNRAKIANETLALVSAKKSGLSLKHHQRTTKIEDHFKSASDTRQDGNDANNPSCPKSCLAGRFDLKPVGTIRKPSRTPGAPLSVQPPTLSMHGCKKTPQLPASRIAAMRDEHRLVNREARNVTSSKQGTRKHVPDSIKTPPQKTKYDLIREQKKLEADQRRLERDKAIEAEKLALAAGKCKKKELLRMANVSVANAGTTVSSTLKEEGSVDDEVEEVDESLSLPERFRFCDLRPIDEVYRNLLSEKSTSSKVVVPQSFKDYFRSVDSYVRYWEPLLIEECRAAIGQSMTEERLYTQGGGKHRLEFSVCDSAESIGWRQVVTISRDMRDDSRPKSGSTEEEYSVFNLHKSDLVLLDIPPIIFDNSIVPQSTKAVAIVEGIELARGHMSLKLNTAFKSADMTPGKGRIIKVCRLMSLTTFLRQYDALRETAKFPDGILWPILSPVEGWRINGKVVEELVKAKDPELNESLMFVKTLKSKEFLNKSQSVAIESVLHSCAPLFHSRKAFKDNIGDHGGVTLIQGPPGTGKTSTIIALLAALLFSNPSVNKFRKAGISIEGRRMIVKLPPIRVLMCAPSNAAVDEIMTRVVNEGLVLPSGGTACPRVVRVGGGTTIESLQRLDLRKLAKCDEPSSIFDAMIDKASASKKIHIESMQKLNDGIGILSRARNNLRDKLTKVMSESNCPEEIENLEKEIRLQTDQLTSLFREKDVLHDLLSNDRQNAREAESRRKQEKDHSLCSILNNASIVFATLNSSGHEIVQRFSARFDLIIVDEAAQCCEPDILIPLSAGRRSLTASPGFGHLVLVGDPRQLPATVLCDNPAVSKLLSRSLFERFAEHASKSVHLLNVQYRMHPKISAFPNREFYSGQLNDGKNVHSDSMSQSFHMDPRNRFGPLTFLDTSLRSSREVRSPSGSISNPDEAKIIVSTISAIVRAYPDVSFLNKIAVLSPYRDQVARIRKKLNEFNDLEKVSVEVNTIDGIQGREKPIVILSTVRGENGRDIGFVRDERRMNVAITRAKHSMIIVGHSKVLSHHSSAWRNLVSFCEKEKCIVQTPLDLLDFFPECRREFCLKNGGKGAKRLRIDTSDVVREIRKKKAQKGHIDYLNDGNKPRAIISGKQMETTHGKQATAANMNSKGPVKVIGMLGLRSVPMPTTEGTPGASQNGKSATQMGEDLCHRVTSPTISSSNAAKCKSPPLQPTLVSNVAQLTQPSKEVYEVVRQNENSAKTGTDLTQHRESDNHLERHDERGNSDKGKGMSRNYVGTSSPSELLNKGTYIETAKRSPDFRPVLVDTSQIQNVVRPEESRSNVGKKKFRGRGGRRRGWTSRQNRRPPQYPMCEKRTDAYPLSCEENRPKIADSGDSFQSRVQSCGSNNTTINGSERGQHNAASQDSRISRDCQKKKNPSGFSLLEMGRQLERTNEIVRRAQGP